MDVRTTGRETAEDPTRAPADPDRSAPPTGTRRGRRHARGGEGRRRIAGLEVDTNTNIGDVPPPREEDPDFGDGGHILASKVVEILPPTPKSKITFPLWRQTPC
eukprot:7869592-Pyramimonas_sp.AAC.1